MADILISGYHGFRNSGDEALLFAILDTLRKKRPTLSVTVLSKTPQETAAQYDVHSISRYSFGKIRKEMKKSRMLLFGGGSLLQDVTSSKSILYYLAILWLAGKSNMKIILYANGIGPITHKWTRRLAAKILNRVDVITLRDDKSDEELKRLGVTRPEVTITADPAFTLAADETISGKYFRAIAGVDPAEKLCIVSVRHWSRATATFETEMARLCDFMVREYGLTPLFVPMQYPADLDIARSIIEKMEEKAHFLGRELSVPEMFAVLSEGEAVIGMRLHSLIYATTLAMPAMALVYDPKISAFMESLNQPDRVNVEAFTFEEARAVLENLLKKREERRVALRETNKRLRAMAEENAHYALSLLDKYVQNK